jgi:exonuclease VII small subunit
LSSQKIDNETRADYEKELEDAIKIVEQLESRVDIFTLNIAIATILERRSKSKSVCAKWLSERFQDIENPPQDKMHPLVMDLA